MLVFNNKKNHPFGLKYKNLVQSKMPKMFFNNCKQMIKTQGISDEGMSCLTVKWMDQALRSDKMMQSLQLILTRNISKIDKNEWQDDFLKSNYDFFNQHD